MHPTGPTGKVLPVKFALAGYGSRGDVEPVAAVGRELLRRVGEVNRATVFPVCRAVVHHGGAGTTAAGMRAGLPTLILWLGVDDQLVWAATVERLKVGSGQDFRATTVDSLVAAQRGILTADYVTRARAIAGLMATPAESVARAADLLEDTARARR